MNLGGLPKVDRRLPTRSWWPQQSRGQRFAFIAPLEQGATGCRLSATAQQKCTEPHKSAQARRTGRRRRFAVERGSLRIKVQRCTLILLESARRNPALACARRRWPSRWLTARCRISTRESRQRCRLPPKTPLPTALRRLVWKAMQMSLCATSRTEASHTPTRRKVPRLGYERRGPIPLAGSASARDWKDCSWSKRRLQCSVKPLRRSRHQHARCRGHGQRDRKVRAERLL